MCPEDISAPRTVSSQSKGQGTGCQGICKLTEKSQKPNLTCWYVVLYDPGCNSVGWMCDTMILGVVFTLSRALTLLSLEGGRQKPSSAQLHLQIYTPVKFYDWALNTKFLVPTLTKLGVIALLPHDGGRRKTRGVQLHLLIYIPV